MPTDQGSMRHAPSDVRGRGFLIFFIGFVVAGFLIHLVVYYGYAAMLNGRQKAPASPLGNRLPIPPEPRVEGSAAHPNLPSMDLKELQILTDRQLTSYGWTDRDAGLVHIPIQRAMELVLQRGLPSAESETTKSRE